MRETETAESWVVYLMTLPSNQTPMRAVCSQKEWESMELARPGFHSLLQAGIGTEGEAEKLARGKSGDPAPRRVPAAKNEQAVNGGSNEGAITLV